MNRVWPPICPYPDTGVAVADGEFIGREAYLKELHQAFGGESPRIIVLEGPRRIGKTSILKRFEHELNARATVIYADVRDLGERTPIPDLSRIVLLELADQLARRSVGRIEHAEFGTPNAFRANLLPALVSTFGGRRIVLLLDEVDWLARRSQEAVQDLLRAFRTDLSPAPFLVLAVGRPFGETRSEAVGWALKHALELKVGPFEDHEMEEAERNARAYTFKQEARDTIRILTAGHPLYVMGIHQAIYARKFSNDDRSPVTVQEVLQAIDTSHDRIGDSLEHAWDQLTPTQSNMGRALAEIAGREDHDPSEKSLSDMPSSALSARGVRYLKSGTLENVARELEAVPGLDPPSVTDLQIEAKGLQQSYVLKPDGDRYRLYSPYLGYWLCKFSYDYLDSNRREAGGLVGEAKSFLDQGDRPQALRALERARALDYSNPEACILLAEFEEAEGRNENALHLLRDALRRHPKDVQPLLIKTVEKLMRVAVRDGRDPRVWYRYLYDVGLDTIAETSLSSFLTDYFLNRWDQALQASQIQEAAEAFDQLASENLPGWRKRALERYTALTLTYVESDVRARNCLFAVRDAFVRLTEEALEEETGSDVQLRVLERLGTLLRDNPDALQVLRAEKAQLQPVAPWWVSTLKVLEHGMERRLDEGEARLPAETLRLLAYRVPMPLRDDLVMCYQQHLPDRIRGRLREDPQEGSRLVRLLFEYGPLVDPEKLWSVLDQHILELDAIPDDKVIAFFEEYPRIYESLLTPSLDERPDLDTVRKVSDQCVLVLERMHRAAAGGKSLDAIWTKLRSARTNIEQWIALVDHLAEAGSSRVDAMRALTAVPVQILRRAAAEAKPMSAARRPLSQRVVVVGGANLELDKEFPLDIPGVRTEFIKRYVGTWKKETVTVKHYLFPPGQSTAVHEFVQRLWEAEQRVLFDVATRRRGRAFAKLLDAKTDPEAGGLIMISEYAGHRSLRNLIDESHPDLRHPARRGALWRELLAVMEAVGTLHSANFIHRTIRPENIIVSGEADGLRLKLVNFEWSVYLHALSAQYPGEGRHFDIYSAPEILENHIGSGAGDPAGENFGADVYALGVVFFESLVRRLTGDELGYYIKGRKYDRVAHRELIKRLQREAHAMLSTDDERLLIRGMLEFNLPRLRLDDTTIDVARRIAFRMADVQERMSRSVPVLSTTSFRGTPESIENFLPREFISRIGPGSEDLKLSLCKQLAGARIYRNLGDPSRPLFIECRELMFVASPFEHKGIPYKEVPYLRVAWTEDQKTGPLIAQLPENVQVVDIQVTRNDLDQRRAATLSNGETWRRMFELAAIDAGKLAPAQREFHTILRVSAAVERELWQRQVVPYRLIDEGQNRGFPSVTITSREINGSASDGLSLSQFVTRQMGREERYFDLGRRSYALAPFSDRGLLWQPVDVDTKRDVVVLVRYSGGDQSDVPPEGFLRPSSLGGNRALHERRQQLLAYLEDDDFLLGAVYRPEEYFSDNEEELKEFINKNLDDDKKRIVSRVMGSRPLFVVQGPPGTGKTTLAAEVIQQELMRRPSARILVASQAHEPLNNLMFRVDEAVSPEKASAAVRRQFSHEPSLPQMIAVRLPPPPAYEMLGEDDNEPERNPAERFYPDAVADRCLQTAQRWAPQAESRVTPQIVDQWRTLLNNESQRRSVSLTERVVSAANLVYATANDRSLNRMPDFDVFDLLIFEEAAKAYPLEVLGPMRRARRWLLIGDQNQLPPFNIEEFREELDARIAQALSIGAGPRLGGHSSDAAAHLNLSQRSAEKARDMADFFATLHERGMRAERALRFADRLTRQWRMHPSIGNMLKTVYYEYLENGDESYLAQARQHNIIEPAQLRGKTLVWIDIPEFESVDPAVPSRLEASQLAGEELAAGGGFRNYFEFNALMKFLGKIKTKGYGGLTKRIVFLAPYWAQVRLINESLLATWENRQTGSLKNLAFTVDSFQGRQSDIAVVSLVRNNAETGLRAKFGFLESENRAGVMFSRAESLLVVVGCSAHFRKDTDGHIAKVFDYVSKHGVVISATELLEPSNYQVMERLLRGRQLKREAT